MRRLRWPGLIMAMTAAQLNAPCASAAPQAASTVTAAIRHAEAAILPANATLTLGPVQGAQFMQSCLVPLAVSITGNPPYEQAAVHCPALGWTLYVSVTVAASETVVVTARPIAAGQALQSADVTMRAEPVTLYAGRQVFYDTGPLTGASATMNLPAGTILTSGNIAEPVVVRAGQTVSVDVISNNINVSVNAVADQSGRVGDTVLMTNPSTGQHFPAQVTASGVVVTLQ